jgi:hypothetical protein
VPNTADSSWSKHKEPESGGQVTRICKKGKYEKCGKHKASVSTKYGFLYYFQEVLHVHKTARLTLHSHTCTCMSPFLLGWGRDYMYMRLGLPISYRASRQQANMLHENLVLIELQLYVPFQSK